MVAWAAIVGALIGWIWCDFEVYGLPIGGILGALAGLALRGAVRREIAAQTAALRMQVAGMLASEPGQAAPVAPVVPVAPVASAPPAPVPVRTVAPEPDPERVRPVFREPLPPPEPSAAAVAMAAGVARARAWLLGGNTIVRVGLVILFVGLAFLASYAASAGLFPLELRLALVAAFGIALLAIGFRTRDRRPGFALALQGAGVATIYLTLFGAAMWFGAGALLPALVLMVAICALGAALALFQQSQALAVTAFAGGFAAPMLLSSGGGEVALLFAYFTVLNLAILAIARVRGWRGLNLLGFFATFGTATLWELAGTHGEQAAGHAYVIASVLIYAAAAILYARHTSGRVGQMVDTTLLFGPAVAGFGLEAGLLHDRPFGSAFAALGFAALYIALARFNRRRGEAAVLNDALLAIGIGFVTLAVPLALGARWTSAAWALEGAGAVWVGMRQGRWLPRAFGMLLQLVAALVFLAALRPDLPAPPLVGAGFVGAMLIAAAAFATAWWLRDPPVPASPWSARWAPVERALAAPAFLFGFAFWWGAWAIEAMRRVAAARGATTFAFAADIRPLLAMVAFVASAWGAQAVGRRSGWRVATWPAHATIAVLWLVFVAQVADGAHVFIWPGVLLWAAAVGVHARLLYLSDRDEDASEAAVLARRAGHVGSDWLATAMLADGMMLAIGRGGLRGTGWGDAGILAVLVVALAALTHWATRQLSAPAAAMRWPLAGHARDHGWIAAGAIAALAALMALVVGVISPGSADPLPYLPLLNPVDLTLLATLGAILMWRRAIREAVPQPPGAAVVVGRGGLAAIGGLAFVLVNTMWLRAAHHLAGVAWQADALAGSFEVQAGLAILWTLLALTVMVAAHRRAARAPWLAGAVLLGVTVVKLLLVDLTNVGGAARIVTFMGVGVLMLVVGYLAPLPPRDAEGVSA